MSGQPNSPAARTRSRAPAQPAQAEPTQASTAQAQPAQAGGIQTVATPRGQAAIQQGGWLKTGEQAEQARQRELARQQQQAERRATRVRIPRRVYLQYGEEADIILLDNELGPCLYEHRLWDQERNRPIFENCPKEFEPCSLCDEIKESYYVQLQTCIDMRSFTRQDGSLVPFSYRLLPVMAEQQEYFKRLKADHGTLRGVHLVLRRPAREAEEYSPTIGYPEFIEKVSEEDIIQSFGHPEERDPANPDLLILEANARCFPFNYALMPPPSAEVLRQRYGGNAPIGAASDLDQEFVAPHQGPGPRPRGHMGGHMGGHGGGHGGGGHFGRQGYQQRQGSPGYGNPGHGSPGQAPRQGYGRPVQGAGYAQPRRGAGASVGATGAGLQAGAQHIGGDLDDEIPF